MEILMEMGTFTQPITHFFLQPRNMFLSNAEGDKVPICLWFEHSTIIALFTFLFCRWRDYASLARLSELPLSKQLIVFRSCLSPEMHEVLVYGLNVRDDDTSRSVDDILAAVRAYIKDKRNLTLDRYY